MDHGERDQRRWRGGDLGLTRPRLLVQLPELSEFFLEAREPLKILVFGGLRCHDGDPPAIEQGLNECIGVAHNGVCKSSIECAVESKHCGKGLALRQIGNGLRQLPDEEFPELLQLLDHFPCCQAPRCCHLSVGLANHEPQLSGLTPEWAS